MDLPIHENMTDMELKIFNKLSNKSYFPHQWSDQDKMFGVKLCMTENQEDNLKYIEENWQHIHESKIQDMLIILVRNNSIESKIFKFLTKVWTMDKNYTNVFGNNCLHIACGENNDISMIKYLIEEKKFDCSHVNKNRKNCLHLACMKNNIDVIKYLAEIIDPNSLDGSRNNCLMVMICNKKIVYPEIIKHWIDDKKIDINATNSSGLTCGTLGCKNNQSLEIIKLLIPKPMNNQQIDNETMIQNNQSLRHACMFNKNLDVIKYLIQIIGANPLATDENGDNCLTGSCWQNDSLEIIKYLINDLKMDISHLDRIDGNCFVAACMNPLPSLSVIKYLITSTDVDVNCMNRRCKTGLHYLKDNQILGFLINHEKINIKLGGMDILKITHILKNLNDNNKFNHLIPSGISCYRKDVIQEIVKDMNPFILTESNKKMLKINPFADKSFDQCIELLDKLKQKVSVPQLPCKKMVIGKNVLNDFSKPPELLFTHNNEIYYGHRDIVCETMYYFKNMDKDNRWNKNHILEGFLPRDLIVRYIKSLYTGSLDFEQVQEQHFIPFLKFIEQYPGSSCSIEKLEKYIVKYIDKTGIEYCEYLKYICYKYQLKSMYLSMHNRKY